jgi:GTP-binding protein EngB required for normal cell division
MAMIEDLELASRRYLIVLTKKDKISPSAAVERRAQLAEATEQCVGCIDILPYSVETNDTRENLMAILKRECAL